MQADSRGGRLEAPFVALPARVLSNSLVTPYSLAVSSRAFPGAHPPSLLRTLPELLLCFLSVVCVGPRVPAFLPVVRRKFLAKD